MFQLRQSHGSCNQWASLCRQSFHHKVLVWWNPEFLPPLWDTHQCWWWVFPVKQATPYSAELWLFNILRKELNLSLCTSMTSRHSVCREENTQAAESGEWKYKLAQISTIQGARRQHWGFRLNKLRLQTQTIPRYLSTQKPNYHPKGNKR